MNFELSEEQVIMRDSIGKFLADHYDFQTRTALLKSGQKFSQSLWQDAAELGWLSIPFSEEVGGLGGTAVELMILFRELGRFLVREPFLETLVLGGGLLRSLSTQGRYAEKISNLIAGNLQCALAHEEYGTGYTLDAVATRAARLAQGYRIEGRKSVVYNAPNADILMITAMLENDGIALFMVPARQQGIETRDYTTVDARRASDLNFNGLVVPDDALMASGEAAVNALQDGFGEAVLACASEQAGMMDALLKATIGYTRERRQFGTEISNFQVLQHCMADMYMDLELTVSLMYAAAIKLRDRSADAARFVAALKVKADSCARRVAHSAFQLHGGIASSDECSIGHYLKRVTMITQFFGGTSYHLQRYIRAAQASTR